jgi:beta-glucosidase
MADRKTLVGACAVVALLTFAAGAHAEPSSKVKRAEAPKRPVAAANEAGKPWLDRKLDPDKRADLVLERMSLDDQLQLLHGVFPIFMKTPPKGARMSAGFVQGLPHLAIPDLLESDASLGVANAGRKDDDATPLPSGLAIASTFSPELAYAGGAMIGKQARQKGFNVMLAGGVNLVRDPRNGRNFEYLGEDPLLAGTLDGASIKGIQSNHIISTAKHYALNDQETGRQILDARIDEAAFRESDLLAFEIAIKTGDPGSVMCAYNRVNGVYACEHDGLLNGTLKQDWGWRGFTMSDWGAVHSLGAAMAGLDQQSGAQLDKEVYFDKPLKAAVEKGDVPAARVRDMAHRVLRSLFAKGVVDNPLAPGGLDTAADAEVSGRTAEQGVVLLRNEGGLLPLVAGAKKIVVIGSHADVGVLSGGGSSQVVPKGSLRFPAPKGAPSWGGGMVFHPSSPLKAIQARAKGAEVIYDSGSDPAAAAALARGADVAIVFASQWSTEGMDLPLALPDGQDGLIEQVAAANPRTVVVLETGGPVLTPWSDKVGAILEAWYPGAKGGEAIGRILFGEVNPSGRLPVTFPTGEDQLPRPELPGLKDWTPEGLANPTQQKPFAVDYAEGSDVGYRWFARTGRKPAYPFGHGLSYTQFRYGELKVEGGRALTATFSVTNSGSRAGIDTPQLYLSRGPNRSQLRLLGWSRVELKPGETRQVTIKADKRLLADWDDKAHGWRIDGGSYDVFVGPDAQSASLKSSTTVNAWRFGP